MEPVGNLVSSALVFGFGIAMLLIAFGIVRETLERISLRLQGHRATGVVVSVAEEKDSDGHPEYRPTVDFVARTGERKVAPLAYPVRTRPRTGGRIAVLYRPGDLGHVVPTGIGRGILHMIFFPILVVSGLAAMGISVIMLLGLDNVPLWHGHVLHTGRTE
ncbi:DUF3592 domain-containing protein [Nocardia aurantia]|uniref:DUF3592 domain-containing protein n=1 Tax=Nocardia aurantia TaxID=2585199 RepID=UPI001295D81E|nr:DUF3592 domain-containing protein [Nocardia aurantia]